jgi:hypothetical protein
MAPSPKMQKFNNQVMNVVYSGTLLEIEGPFDTINEFDASCFADARVDGGWWQLWRPSPRCEGGGAE